MASVKYHGKTTKILWSDGYNTSPSVDLSGTSRTIGVQESGNTQDVSTRDDFLENGTSTLATPPERTINAQGLDTKPDTTRPWADINVSDEGTVAVYPYGDEDGYPYWIGNAVVTNRNYESPHDNAATWQVQFRVNGAWTDGVV